MKDKGSKIDVEIIEAIKKLHLIQVKNKEPFLSKHLKNYNLKFTNRLERNKVSWSHALAASGVDPRCHFGQFSYGKTEGERKRTFRNIIRSIANKHGEESLNDNTMNSNEMVDIPAVCWENSLLNDNFPECEVHGCKHKKLSRKSIYANGRRLFGNWNDALLHSDIHLRNVIRKPSSIEFESIVKSLYDYDVRTKSKWTITKIRKENSKLAKSIYNLKNRKNIDIPFNSISEDVVYVTWVNMIHLKEKNIISEDLKWYEEFKDNLEKIFNLKHYAQERWDENSIVLGIQSIYGKGETKLRLSRDDVSKRGDLRDKTLWGAIRQKRFRESGLNENEWFKKSGILIEKLREKYRQIDEKYTAKECLDFFSMLMQESLNTGENRLTREYNYRNNLDFVNFIVNKYGSWESGLSEHGLDPKFFSITASKRAKRGYVFQKFVEEKFILYGLKSVTSKPHNGEFVSNRSIKTCQHEVRCKPDFLFKDLIIDTKTGYHASQKPEQLW